MTRKHTAASIAAPEVYIVDGARSPFIKAKGKPGPFSAADLAVPVCQQLIARRSLPDHAIDEVITGCAVASCDETNISRIIALRSGLSEKTPAWTVQRNCASGLQALDSAMLSIQSGRSQLVLAGGTDAMSRGPILHNDAMVRWLSQFYQAKTWQAKGKHLARLRPAMLKPVIGLMRGLTDPICGLTMGQTAEILAYDFGISRDAMDQLAYDSHQRVAAAQQRQHFDEIVPLFDRYGKTYTADDGVRVDTTVDKLAKLKASYDKPFGSVTAGNSSQISDGAAFLLLASKQAVEQYQLPTLAKIVDCQWGALNPAIMGLGPVHAIVPLLQRHAYQLSDID